MFFAAFEPTAVGKPAPERFARPFTTPIAATPAELAPALRAIDLVGVLLLLSPLPLFEDLLLDESHLFFFRFCWCGSFVLVFTLFLTFTRTRPWPSSFGARLSFAASLSLLLSFFSLRCGFASEALGMPHMQPRPIPLIFQ